MFRLPIFLTASPPSRNADIATPAFGILPWQFATLRRAAAQLGAATLRKMDTNYTVSQLKFSGNLTT